MFETEGFIEACRRALDESEAHAAVREVVQRSVAEPDQIIRALGEPTRAGVYPLHRSPELTVIHFVWGPHMELPPHDHRMWAVIGLYTGKEVNAFYRRSPLGIQPSGGKELGAKDACPLGGAVIHSVTNPLGAFTGAVHVYGGDFFGVPRSQWDPDSLEEQPYDVDYVMQLFEDSNRAIEGKPAMKGAK